MNILFIVYGQNCTVDTECKGTPGLYVCSQQTNKCQCGPSYVYKSNVPNNRPSPNDEYYFEYNVYEPDCVQSKWFCDDLGFSVLE